MSKYIFEQSYIDFLKSKQVTAYVGGRDVNGFDFYNVAVVGYPVEVGNTIYYLADLGFEFKFIDGYTPSASIGHRSPMGGVEWFNYDFDNPNRAFQKVDGFSFSKADNVTLIKSTAPLEVKGVNDVYKITNATMKAIINGNFNRFDGQETTDYGKYLLGLIELPFNIEASFIIEPDKLISLGGLTFTYKGDLLKSDVLKINLGSIATPETKNNFLDYSNKTAILHLPYCEPILLEIQYVVGETISIEYQINLYDGLTVVNISSSKINGVILTRNVDLNVAVPFGSVSSQPSKNDPRNVVLGGDNGVKNPYIELLSNNAILENGFFTIPIIDETEIVNCSGFIKVDEINLVSKATTNEKNMIVSLLSRGIVI